MARAAENGHFFMIIVSSFVVVVVGKKATQKLETMAALDETRHANVFEPITPFFLLLRRDTCGLSFESAD